MVGGKGWPTSLEQGAAVQPLVVSCYPRDKGHDRAARLEQSLGLDHIIKSVDTVAPGELLGHERSGFILDLWERQTRPVLWVKPGAVMAGAPALLAAIDCDFAAHKWNRWEMAPRTLYFGRSSGPRRHP